MFNSLQWKIIFIYTMLILFSLQLVSVYLVQSLEQYYLRNYKESLENQAMLLSAFVQPAIREGRPLAEETVSLARGFRDLQDMEFILLDSHAHVIGTSGSQDLVGRRLIRDEITRALSGNLSDNIRLDRPDGERRYYLAYPVEGDQATIGVIYLSGSLQPVDNTLNEIKGILLSGTALALMISFILGFVLTKTITAPITEITGQAKQMAGGDYSKTIKVQSDDEIGRLGSTFNYRARQLSHTINEMSSEKSKVEAIINNMSDGVVALDGRGHLIQLNPAAKNLLRSMKLPVPPLHRSGFNLMRSLIGPKATRQFIRCQDSMQTELSGVENKYTVQVRVAPFKVEKGKLDGTLIVLHDVTRDRELTRRQEEFVADVSHELRTPLATFKSYVETLRDGAGEEPLVRNRFLDVLSAETERMVSMVKDLLVLSQLDTTPTGWRHVPVDLRKMIPEAVDQLQHKGRLALPRITMEIPNDLPLALVDRDKVMRVLENLLANAVRYTSPEGSVTVSARSEKDNLLVQVRDTGSGIAADELPRVFERFYRVEKTRSRDYGGSGLGLSIARKIIEAHGGIIWIESMPGVGTTVFLTLPAVTEGRCSYVD